MLGRFFIITFAASWTSCGLASRIASPGLQTALVYLGTFAPGLVALFLTALAEGGNGVRALLASLFRWRVQARWYAFALGFIITVKLTVAVLMLLHSAVNNTKDIVPSAQAGALHVFALSTSAVAWMTLALLWIAAIWLLVQMSRGQRFSR